MSSEEGFRRFLSETKEKALKIADQSHVTIEARETLKDFLEISNQIVKLLDSRFEGTAETRILQKRYEALKVEHRELKKTEEKIRETITTEMMALVKKVNGDLQVIGELATTRSDAQTAEHLSRIKTALKKAVEALVKG